MIDTADLAYNLFQFLDIVLTFTSNEEKPKKNGNTNDTTAPASS